MPDELPLRQEGGPDPPGRPSRMKSGGPDFIRVWILRVRENIFWVVCAGVALVLGGGVFILEQRKTSPGTLTESVFHGSGLDRPDRVGTAAENRPSSIGMFATGDRSSKASSASGEAEPVLAPGFHRDEPTDSGTKDATLSEVYEETSARQPKLGDRLLRAARKFKGYFGFDSGGSGSSAGYSPATGSAKLKAAWEARPPEGAGPREGVGAAGLAGGPFLRPKTAGKTSTEARLAGPGATLPRVRQGGQGPSSRPPVATPPDRAHTAPDSTGLVGSPDSQGGGGLRPGMVAPDTAAGSGGATSASGGGTGGMTSAGSRQEKQQCEEQGGIFDPKTRQCDRTQCVVAAVVANPTDNPNACLEFTCKGISGKRCYAPKGGLHCNLKIGEVAACTSVLDTCSSAYAPVCGSDGVTYDNECKAQKAGRAVVSSGPCAGVDAPRNCVPSDYENFEVRGCLEGGCTGATPRLKIGRKKPGVTCTGIDEEGFCFADATCPGAAPQRVSGNYWWTCEGFPPDNQQHKLFSDGTCETAQGNCKYSFMWGASCTFNPTRQYTSTPCACCRDASGNLKTCP